MKKIITIIMLIVSLSVLTSCNTKSKNIASQKEVEQFVKEKNLALFKTNNYSYTFSYEEKSKESSEEEIESISIKIKGSVINIYENGVFYNNISAKGKKSLVWQEAKLNGTKTSKETIKEDMILIYEKGEQQDDWENTCYIHQKYSISSKNEKTKGETKTCLSNSVYYGVSEIYSDVIDINKIINELIYILNQDSTYVYIGKNKCTIIPISSFSYTTYEITFHHDAIEKITLKEEGEDLESKLVIKFCEVDNITKPKDAEEYTKK